MDEGWLFAAQTGRGTSPRTDYDDWKELLDHAKVRDGRLHDARHTAATAMAARYQHMVDSVRSDVARQVDGLIWKPDGAVDGGST